MRYVRFMERKPTSFRLTAKTLCTIRRLASSDGMSQAAIVTKAVVELEISQRERRKQVNRLTSNQLDIAAMMEAIGFTSEERAKIEASLLATKAAIATVRSGDGKPLDKN